MFILEKKCTTFSRNTPYSHIGMSQKHIFRTVYGLTYVQVDANTFHWVNLQGLISLAIHLNGMTCAFRSSSILFFYVIFLGGHKDMEVLFLSKNIMTSFVLSSMKACEWCKNMFVYAFIHLHLNLQCWKFYFWILLIWADPIDLNITKTTKKATSLWTAEWTSLTELCKVQKSEK